MTEPNRFVMTDKRQVVVAIILASDTVEGAKDQYIAELLALKDDFWPENPTEIYKIIHKYMSIDYDDYDAEYYDEWTEWDLSDW